MILSEAVSVSPFGADRIDKAVRRFNAVGADAVLQRVGIVASCVNDERAIQPVYLRRAGRRNRHAVYFSEEGVRRGDIIGQYVAGGVGGDTVNGIGVVWKSPTYSQ